LLDSSGINVLVQAYKRVRDSGHHLRTTGEQDQVLAIIEASGLTGYFHDHTPPHD
jgi:anti-anti-sigma factor